jgi:hypothetical protein
MIQLKSLLDIITSIIENKNKYIILSWLFLGIIIWYLFNDNTALQLQLDNINAVNQANINKSINDCEEQIKLNRSKFQNQLDNSEDRMVNFINKSNKERDSTYLYFYNELRKANAKINEKTNSIQ